MARAFVLGNGHFLVCLDSNGLVRDVYYPYVGQENHVNGKIHYIGIWVDSSFSWLTEDVWEKQIWYKKETLVTTIFMTNKSLGIQIEFHDAVINTHSIFIREVIVSNMQDAIRTVSLFFYQVFDIAGSNIGITAFYNPLVHAIVHYKERRYFLLKTAIDNVCTMSSYATGLYGEFGKEGTWKDAEDGKLSENSIEHGSVDSVISLNFVLQPKGCQRVYYWFCAGKDLDEVAQLNEFIEKNTPQVLLKHTEMHWRAWVNRTPFEFYGLSQEIVDLFKRSLLIIQCHADNGGSIIASSDSDGLQIRRDTYAYMWPRDGALIIRALDRAGYFELTQHFFNFCVKALDPQGYLFHKYCSDGSLGSSWHPWIEEGNIQLPIQEDQIALVLDALWKHHLVYGKEYTKSLFSSFIRPIENFLLNYIDEHTGLPKESYDVWEEKLGIHTFTCCATYAGINAAGYFEREFGDPKRAEHCVARAASIKENTIRYLYDEKEKRFIKRIFYTEGKLQRDMTFDASNFYGIFQFGLLDIYDDRVRSSVNSFLKNLKNNYEVGGYLRYPHDQYYRSACSEFGNPWFITTLWLAEYYIMAAKSFDELTPAIKLFAWVTHYALDTGILSEQIDACTGMPLSVAPLTWSHAAFVIAVIKYLEKLDDLGICALCSPPSLRGHNKKIK